MKRSRVRLGIMLLLSVSFVLVCFYPKPQAVLAKPTVRFVGFTNEISGTNLAIFILSNTGDSPIEVGLPVEIELRHTRHYNPGRLSFPTRLSSASVPLTVKVVTPSIQDQWRVAFNYHPPNPGDRFRGLLNRFTAPLGIQMRGRGVIVSTVHSEWIDPAGQMEGFGFDWTEY